MNVHDRVVLYMNNIVIPQALRKYVLDHLQSAQQGVTGMLVWAQATMYWPGISVESDIESKMQVFSHHVIEIPHDSKGFRSKSLEFQLYHLSYFFETTSSLRESSSC